MANKGKTGVLLVNLGTPDSPDRGAVYRYLKEFLLDKRVIDVSWLKRNLLVRGIIAPFRSRNTSELYKKLWLKEGSPLKIYGEKLTSQVSDLLGEDFDVELAMRYQKPSIESALENLFSRQISTLIVFPLFPQYASASTGSVHEEVMRILSKKQAIPDVRLINSYYDNDQMQDIYVENASVYNLDDYDHVLFSYHGLPERQLKKADNCNHCLQSADCCSTINYKNQFCYSAQCHATTKGLVSKLGLKEGQYSLCFQSRLGSDPWVQPYTSDVIKKRAELGDKKLLVFCPAFVADCLETTIEVTEEYLEEFQELGGEHVDLVESLNANPKWAQTIKEIILENS